MRKIFAAGALALFLLSGCAEVHSGMIVDAVKQESQYRDGADVCRFQLDNGKEKGWLEVDCDTDFREYEIGEDYPR